jgi:hypothetical protein
MACHLSVSKKKHVKFSINVGKPTFAPGHLRRRHLCRSLKMIENFCIFEKSYGLHNLINDPYLMPVIYVLDKIQFQT